MTSITVRHSTTSIVLSKSFANASSKFGSEAYNQLQQVRRDYPTYTIEIATPKKINKEFFKGLTLEYKTRCSWSCAKPFGWGCCHK